LRDSPTTEIYPLSLHDALPISDVRYCFELPDAFDDAHAAPLLCAGLIGYRSWRFAKDARRLGIYGFGAAAHIVAQIARSQGQERSEEHTSELQSRENLVCRLLL